MIVMHTWRIQGLLAELQVRFHEFEQIEDADEFRDLLVDQLEVLLQCLHLLSVDQNRLVVDLTTSRAASPGSAAERVC